MIDCGLRLSIARASAWLLGLVCALTVGQAAKPELPALPAPSQPVPASVRVTRGKAVPIPLRIYGTRDQTVEFLIRSAPAGKLSEPKPVGPESATVVYTAPADLAVVRDRFSYAVKGRDGVSGSADIVITITDEPAHLSAPASLDFETLKPGQRALRSIQITNQGGSVARGELNIDPPWTIKGATQYALPAGQSQTVDIQYAPQTGGDSRGELRFSSQPDHVTALSGRCIAAFSVSVPNLELSSSRATTRRAGGFELTNNTESELSVTFHAGPRLIVPPTLDLAANSSGLVIVESAENVPAPIREELVIEAAGVRTSLPVSAKAAPGLLRARSQTLQFPSVLPNVPARAELTLENIGGSPVEALCEVSAPFTLERPRLAIEPGSTGIVVVLVAAADPGPVGGNLSLETSGQKLVIPVQASIAGAIRSSTPLSRTSLPLGPTQPNDSPPNPTRQQNDAEISSKAAIIYPQVTAVTSTSATLVWTVPDARNRTFQADSRILSIQEDALKVDWCPLDAFSISHSGDEVTASLSDLMPGTRYFLRITVLAADVPELWLPVTFSTPAVVHESFRIRPMGILLFALAACVAGLYWRKRRH